MAYSRFAVNYLTRSKFKDVKSLVDVLTDTVQTQCAAQVNVPILPFT